MVRKTGKHQRSKQTDWDYVERPLTLHIVCLFKAHWLSMNYIITMFLLVSCMSTHKSHFVFCLVLCRINPQSANKNIQQRTLPSFQTIPSINYVHRYMKRRDFWFRYRTCQNDQTEKWIKMAQISISQLQYQSNWARAIVEDEGRIKPFFLIAILSWPWHEWIPTSIGTDWGPWIINDYWLVYPALAKARGFWLVAGFRRNSRTSERQETWVIDKGWSLEGSLDSSIFACLWPEKELRSINMPISSHFDQTSLVRISYVGLKKNFSCGPCNPKRAKYRRHLARQGSQQRRILNWVYFGSSRSKPYKEGKKQDSQLFTRWLCMSVVFKNCLLNYAFFTSRKAKEPPTHAFDFWQTEDEVWYKLVHFQGQMKIAVISSATASATCYLKQFKSVFRYGKILYQKKILLG